MQRFDIINKFIEAREFQSYLEVGVREHECFDQVIAPFKESVDPDPEANPTYLMTSDEFWKQTDRKYDIIFIDGLHHGDQVYRDIIGALNCLNRFDSVIVLHDCNPQNSVAGRHSLEEYTIDGDWNGDVWTGFSYYRYHSRYHCYTVAEDTGCGVIDCLKLRKTTQTYSENVKQLYSSLSPKDVCYLSYTLLQEHRKELLGLISEETFLENFEASTK